MSGAGLSENFAARLRDLEPSITRVSPGRLGSGEFPFLRYLAAIGTSAADGAVDGGKPFWRSALHGRRGARMIADWPFGDGFMPAPLGGTLRKLFGGNG